MNFKRYNESDNSWTDSHYIKGTATDTITTLPATIYPLTQTVTLGMKGNTVQSGTPTSDNPIMPQGCGDLETVGAKAGQFKIPISSAGQTTPVYLGEVQSTRRIRKLVLTGEENWQLSQASGGRYRFVIDVTDAVNADTSNPYSICSHLPLGASGATYSTDDVYTIASGKLYMRLTVNYNSLTTFKAYLSDQYANGTPVTVWYVLANPETAVVNEPLMKIGSYADSISGISIPTIAGANTLDVDTTVAPSEVTATFNGWHPVSSAHERSGGAWD